MFESVIPFLIENPFVLLVLVLLLVEVVLRVVEPGPDSELVLAREVLGAVVSVLFDDSVDESVDSVGEELDDVVDDVVDELDDEEDE